MGPASFRSTVKGTSVLSVLLALFSFGSLAFAQTLGVPKHKRSNHQLVLSERPLVGGASARVTARSASKPPSTTDNWTGTAGDNNWGTAGNWSAGVPNGSNFLVTIGTTTAAVNLNINAAVGSLTLSNSGDSLAILNNMSLTADGNITNNGSINLGSGGNLTELIVGASNVTLSGTGTLTMGNNLNNLIVGSAAANKLTNSETIQGSGNIGAGQMALANSGTIDATQSNALTIQTSNGNTNTGTLEATTGTLVLLGDTITNTGGTIKSTGSDVQLTNGVTVVGGTLTTTGSGLIHTVGGQTSTLNGLTNSGNYQVDNNAITNLVGTITNSKNINMASGGNFTDLVINGNVSLAGTGTLTMSNNPNNYIFGTAASNILTVGSGQTISGSGSIGFDPNTNVGQMALANNGIIDATQSNNLVIRTSNGTRNTGTLEATTGTLVLFGDTITQTGAGNISATGSDVQLQSGVTINGGTLKTSGTGLIHTTGGQTSTLENLTNSGNYQVDNNATTILLGTITNNGNMNLASGGNLTEFQLSGNVTLSGSGTLTMSNNPNNIIQGASTGSEVLTNSITISGAGNIGNGFMGLNNTSLGTIDANQTNALVIAPSSGGVTNTGLLEASGGGILQLNSGTYTNAVGSTQGTILGNGGTVNLETGATIVGGTLKTQNGGLIQDVTNGGATLDGSTSTGAVTIVSGSSLSVINNAVLNVKGSIVNNGTVSLNSGGNFTDLVVTGTSATLSGAGTLAMSNNVNNRIYGAVGTDVFTNASTITGSGNIGFGQMVFVNSGTVNANQSNALTIQTSGGTTNTGTLEATAGGTLLLNGFSGGNITNTGGTIQANGATGNSAAVNLENGINITGGTITSNNFGSFNVLNTATLTGLTSTATVNVANNTVLTLAGTIVNNGALNLNSGGNFTDLVLSGNVALNGTGTVTMSNNPNNRIYGGLAADVLTVASTQTIQGAGNIGDGQMVLVNNGTINANVSNALTINVSGGTTNTGTLEASSGGALSLFGGTVTNTGAGKVVANMGGTVFLRSNVIVSGGSLTGGGTFIEDGSGGGATLSGLTNASTVLVNNNTALTLAGTIKNTGSIQENSGGNVTEILISGNATLSGSGTLSMSNNPNNLILGASGAGTEVFTNASTIQGSGNIGNGAMGLVNSGTINANQTNTLFIDVNTKNFKNTGTIEATGTGGLVVIAPAGAFLNYSSGTNTLTGGTYIANGGNVTLPLGSSGGIATLAAKVTEEGGSQILNSNNGNANALNGLTSITSAGALTIGGVAFTDAGTFSNAGSLTLLSGESFTVGSLTQVSGSSLTTGTYVLDANLNLSGAAQNITTNAANLTLAGGTIHNNTGSSNALAGLATNTGKLTIGGTSNNVSTTASSFSNTGTLTINSGDSFTAAALTQISGSTLSGGTFVLGGNLDLTTTGINITTNSSNLTLQGGTIKSGATNALANLNKNTNTLTLANHANFTTTGNFTNSGTMTVNSGSTFGVTGTLTNLSAGTLTGGNYTVGGTMQLASANGGITTNAANLTLTGTSAKILDGTSNALAGFNNNTGTFTLASGATLTTASSNFTNSGAVVVSKGTTLTVGGTSNSYNQSAGTTTVDGTLVGNGTTGIGVTGGKILGAGTLKANVSIGGGGTTPTINVGDAGKAGLLKITGTYAQLSTGTMNVSIGGTTVGTKFSQLQVSGTASLGGTLTAALVNGFTPTVGQTFTVLTASSVAGTFSNSTIAINATEHFAVSYTSTGVVLTVASGPVFKSGTAAAVSQMAMASTKPALGISPHLVLGNELRHRIGGGGKPVWVAGLQRPGGHSNAIVARTTGLYSPRGGERMAMIAGWNHPGWQSVADSPRSVTKAPDYQGSPARNNWIGPNRGINPRPTLVGLLATSANRRAMPIRILRPSPPRMR